MDPRVLEAMLPYFGPRFGNAASRTHSFGWEAEKAVEMARKRVAELAGAAPREIVFTSGATESINLALKGALEALRGKGAHIVTMATEHKAVLDTVRRLTREGCRATVLPPRPDGLIDLDQLRDAILPETVLVSVMAANNEIGTLQPVREIGAVCREKGVRFHCDAAQAFGKTPIDVEAGGIDLMSISAHKMYGPKGVGALYVRRRGRRVEVVAQMDGGGHEYGLRSGTLNVPGIVGLGEACAICAREMAGEAARVAGLRDRLKSRLEAELEGIRVNGSMEHRLAGNLNLSFRGRGWRSPAHEPSGSGALHRFGVQFGHRGTEPCVEGPGPRRPAGAFLGSLRPGPLQYRGGSGICRRPDGPGGAPTAPTGPSQDRPHAII